MKAAARVEPIVRSVVRLQRRPVTEERAEVLFITEAELRRILKRQLRATWR